MGLFDGYYDPQQFADSGGLLGRLLSLQPQLGQYQPGADQAQAVPQTSAPMPMPWPNSANYGQQPSAQQLPTPDLHSQYQALRPLLGDHNAMLAAVNPDVGKTLIAQALANQQKSGDPGGVNSPSYNRPVASDVPRESVRPGSQYAQAAMGLCAAGLLGCAAGAGLTAGQLILGGTALTGAGALILNSKSTDRPPAGSRPIDETDWSGDHTEIKEAVGAKGPHDVRFHQPVTSGLKNPMEAGRTTVMSRPIQVQANPVDGEERIGIDGVK